MRNMAAHETLHNVLIRNGLAHRKNEEFISKHDVFDADGSLIGIMSVGECWSWLYSSLSGCIRWVDM
jgi:hypothetical protein